MAPLVPNPGGRLVKILDNAFSTHIAHLDLAAMESSADPTYITDHYLVIRAANSAYVAFGQANGLANVDGVAGLGCSVLAAMASPAREFYGDAFDSALAENQPFHHDYECSSPERFRKFRLSAYPLPNVVGLVVSSHLIHELEHSQTGVISGPQHLSPDGVVSQCCHCRKVRNWSREKSWDWVPALVAAMHPNTSHTFCEGCMEHFYPDIDD